MKQKNYPLYETTVFENFRVLTENAAKKFPDKAAIIYKENPKDAKVVTKTFSQMRDDIRDFGTGMIRRSADNRHIAIIGESSYHWVCAYFGLMAVGAVTVPLDKDLPAEDLAATCAAAECSAVFYSPIISKKLPAIRAALPQDTLFVCMSKDVAQSEDTTMDEIIAEGAQLFAGGDRGFYEYEIDNKRLATIVFTSGTTGKGKGVMLSQYNIVSDMTQGMYNFAITPSTLNVLPPHHTFGSTVNFVGHLAQGCTVYISSGIRYILQELKEQKPRHLILVPLFVETFYKRIWNNVEKQGKTASLHKLIQFSNNLRRIGIDMRRILFRPILQNFGGNLEMIICGGAALNQDIIDTFDAIGITILNGYGITECSPLISCNRNKYQKKGSVGTPIIGEEVKIADPDANGEGEICVKGPNVMLGYYKDDEATKAAFDADGYFHTGDYGKLDEDGWIYITGRLKNLIIFSNGKNVYPEEIETEISRIYGVGEVVVYAGQSKSNPAKEAIVSEIFPDTDALQLRGIDNLTQYFNEEIRKINERTVSYKAVNIVKLRDTEFQKNTSRKIVRHLIDKTID